MPLPSGDLSEAVPLVPYSPISQLAISFG